MASHDRNGNSHTSEYGSRGLRRVSSVQDWEAMKRRQKDFYDDGTMTFFWRAHTLTVLFIFALVLFYVAIFEEQSTSFDYNTKRGVLATVLTFVLFGISYMPDGPFRRPHPAFWRLILCISIVYELSLVFLLFQNVDDARRLLKYVDEDLGKPLPEKDYGGNCLLYDPDKPDDPYHNLWDKMDGFVVMHFVGWWLKTLILRDYWLCMVISIMFEVMEYTLEHQLPNFSECWWDHWIMDAMVCNALGIYVGMKTLDYLSMKPYHWRGVWNIESYSGKLKRIITQFSPHFWTDYDWKPTSSLKRWLFMLMCITIFLLAELNTFYLKFVLWIPPPHFLCLGRLALFSFFGACSMRECFQYLEDPKRTKLGPQSWLTVAIIITEFLISLKFDWDTLTKPIPSPMDKFWIGGVICILLWTVYHFYIKPFLHHSEKIVIRRESLRESSPDSSRLSKSSTDNNGSIHHLRERNVSPKPR